MANDRAQFEMIFDVVTNGADRTLQQISELQKVVDQLGRTSQITASQKGQLTKALNGQTTAAVKAAAAARANLTMEEREAKATKTLTEAKEQLRLAENRIKANTRKGNTDLVARDTAQAEVQKQRIAAAEQDLAKVTAHRAEEDKKAAAAAELKAAADRKAAEAAERVESARNKASKDAQTRDSKPTGAEEKAQAAALREVQKETEAARKATDAATRTQTARNKATQDAIARDGQLTAAEQRAQGAATKSAEADKKAAEAATQRAEAERKKQAAILQEAEGGVAKARDDYNASGAEQGLDREAQANSRLVRAKEQLAAAELRVKAARASADGDSRELTAALKAEEAALKQATTAQRNYISAQRDAVGQMASTRYALYDVSSTAAVGAGVLIGAGVGIASLSAQWESGMSQVERTSDRTGDSLAALEAELRGLVSSMPIASDEITLMASRAGQLGVSSDKIGAFTAAISKFAAVSDTLNADEAATFIARIGNLTGEDDYERLADMIAKVGVNAAATDQQIARTSQELAQATAAANFTADEIIGLAGAFASLGIPAERARSVTNDLVVEMEEGIAGLNEQLPVYAGLIGRTADETADLWKQDPGTFFTEFVKGVSQSERVVEALSAVGLEGQRAIPAFAALAADIDRAGGSMGSVLVGSLALAAEQYRTGGEVARQYTIIMDDLSSKWQIFINNLGISAQVLGSQFGPQLKETLDYLTFLVIKFNEFAQTDTGTAVMELVGQLAALSAGVLVVVAGLAAFGASSLAFKMVYAQMPGIQRVIYVLTGFQTAAMRAGVASATSAPLVQRLKTAFAGMGTAIGNAGRGLAVFGGRLAIMAGLAAAISLMLDFEGSMYHAGNGLLSLNEISANVSHFLVDAFAWATNGVIDMLNGLTGMATDNLNNLMAAAATVLNVPAPPPIVFESRIEPFDPSPLHRNVETARAQAQRDFEQWQSQWSDPNQAVEEALRRAEDAAARANAQFSDLGNQDLGPLDEALGDTEEATRKAQEAAQAALDAFKTLVDYGNDLSAVWDRAFDIRFSGQSSYDAVTSSFNALRQSAIDSEEKIRDLKNTLRSLSADVAGLTSDMAIQKYYLSIATEYEGGDSERAGAIRADLAKLEAELAEKHADTADAARDLAKENEKASKSLEGNSESAIDNRAAMTDLVKQYQEHIKALASSGMNQDDLARATETLRQDFIRQAQQLGYNGVELQRYASAFDDVALAISRVPRNITVTADTNPAIQALNEIVTRAALEGAAAGKNFADGFGGSSGGLSGGFGTDGAYGSGQSAAQAYRDGFQRWMRQQPIAIEGYLMQGQQVYRVPGTGLRLFSEGGYTGRGGKYQAAGIVHKGEYVVPAQHVNQSTGLPNPDALGRLPRGSQSSGSYARGGHASSSVMPSSIDLSARSVQAIARAVQPHLFLDARALGGTVAKANTQSTVVGAL